MTVSRTIPSKADILRDGMVQSSCKLVIKRRVTTRCFPVIFKKKKEIKTSARRGLKQTCNYGGKSMENNSSAQHVWFKLSFSIGTLKCVSHALVTYSLLFPYFRFCISFCLFVFTLWPFNIYFILYILTIYYF